MNKKVDYSFEALCRKRDEVIREGQQKFNNIIDKFTCLAYGLPSPEFVARQGIKTPRRIQQGTGNTDSPKEKKTYKEVLNLSRKPTAQPSDTYDDDTIHEEIKETLKKRKFELGLPKDYHVSEIFLEEEESKKERPVQKCKSESQRERKKIEEKGREPIRKSLRISGHSEKLKNFQKNPKKGEQKECKQKWRSPRSVNLKNKIKTSKKCRKLKDPLRKIQNKRISKKEVSQVLGKLGRGRKASVFSNCKGLKKHQEKPMKDSAIKGLGSSKNFLVYLKNIRALDVNPKLGHIALSESLCTYIFLKGVNENMNLPDEKIMFAVELTQTKSSSQVSRQCAGSTQRGSCHSKAVDHQHQDGVITRLSSQQYIDNNDLENSFMESRLHNQKHVGSIENYSCLSKEDKPLGQNFHKRLSSQTINNTDIEKSSKSPNQKLLHSGSHRKSNKKFRIQERDASEVQQVPDCQLFSSENIGNLKSQKQGKDKKAKRKQTKSEEKGEVKLERPKRIPQNIKVGISIGHSAADENFSEVPDCNILVPDCQLFSTENIDNPKSEKQGKDKKAKMKQTKGEVKLGCPKLIPQNKKDQSDTPVTDKAQSKSRTSLDNLKSRKQGKDKKLKIKKQTKVKENGQWKDKKNSKGIPRKKNNKDDQKDALIIDSDKNVETGKDTEEGDLIFDTPDKLPVTESLSKTNQQRERESKVKDIDDDDLIFDTPLKLPVTESLSKTNQQRESKGGESSMLYPRNKKTIDREKFKSSPKGSSLHPENYNEVKSLRKSKEHSCKFKPIARSRKSKAVQKQIMMEPKSNHSTVPPKDVNDLSSSAIRDAPVHRHGKCFKPSLSSNSGASNSRTDSDGERDFTSDSSEKLPPAEIKKNESKTPEKSVFDGSINDKEELDFNRRRGMEQVFTDDELDDYSCLRRREVSVGEKSYGSTGERSEIPEVKTVNSKVKGMRKSVSQKAAQKKDNMRSRKPYRKFRSQHSPIIIYDNEGEKEIASQNLRKNNNLEQNGETIINEKCLSGGQSITKNCVSNSGKQVLDKSQQFSEELDHDGNCINMCGEKEINMVPKSMSFNMQKDQSLVENQLPLENNFSKKLQNQEISGMSEYDGPYSSDSDESRTCSLLPVIESSLAVGSYHSWSRYKELKKKRREWLQKRHQGASLSIDSHVGSETQTRVTSFFDLSDEDELPSKLHSTKIVTKKNNNLSLNIQRKLLTMGTVTNNGYRYRGKLRDPVKYI